MWHVKGRQFLDQWLHGILTRKYPLHAQLWLVYIGHSHKTVLHLSVVVPERETNVHAAVTGLIESSISISSRLTNLGRGLYNVTNRNLRVPEM